MYKQIFHNRKRNIKKLIRVNAQRKKRLDTCSAMHLVMEQNIIEYAQ